MPIESFFDNPDLANGNIRQELERALDQAASTAGTLYRSTVATWSRKPTFTTERERDSRTVGTDDEIYEIVSETGSRPHVIRPRRAGGRLRFQSGYRAKTRRGVIGSTGGGASGDVVFSRGVQHPGFEAREFSQQITEQMEGTLERLVDQAMGRLYG